jgi:phage head maturation protease
VSVGFFPTESKLRTDSKKGGIHYLKQTLIEVSLVSIPANPAALLEAKRLGVSSEMIRKVFNQEPDRDETIPQRIRRVRRGIRKLLISH